MSNFAGYKTKEEYLSKFLESYAISCRKGLVSDYQNLAELVLKELGVAPEKSIRGELS